jgi:hypothetical protein
MKVLVAALLFAVSCQATAFDPDELTRKNRELAAREEQKPAWKIKEEAETASIKMKSFNPATVGRRAFLFARPIEDVTPRASMIAILYRDTPCQLPISGAKDMFAAESLYGRALVPACWGRLITPSGDDALIVSKYGDTRKETLLNYAEVEIRPDGSGKFLKPAFSREQFMQNVDDFHKALR